MQRNIIIVEKEVIITDKKQVAEKLNNFFIEAVESLEIEQYAPDTQEGVYLKNIDGIVKKYESHPSILKIKENVKLKDKFLFNDMISDDLKTEISELNPNKASIENDIPAKILIVSKDIVSYYLSNIYNNCKHDNQYPLSLKAADVTPIHKKDEKTAMKNYRPVSLIPIVSKLFERNMYDQILEYMNNFLSPYLFGYRKGHSTEQCLMVMLEIWRKALDENNSAGGILTDLSKAFDCLNHNLLIAKLEAYGFGINALKFVYNYLKERKQRTKVSGSYSTWRELKFGVPQGSILGPLLFNIFINDIFYFINTTKITNYADDNTIYSVDDNLTDLLNILQTETNLVLKWFRLNEMKSNDDKCHLIIANQENVSVTLGNEIIEATNSVELLGVKISKIDIYVKKVIKNCMPWLEYPNT